MFKVSHGGCGFRISIGDHRPADARNLEEVHEALDHYYAGSVGDKGHHGPGPVGRPACPFCREIVQRYERHQKEVG
jgi:hypothetical protein